MKAYVATDEALEGALLLSARTNREAHILAWRENDWHGGEAAYMDIRVLRYPEGDRFAAEDVQPRVWPDRRYREMGWSQIDGGGACAECDLHEWDDVPESRLSESWGEDICRTCLAAAGRVWQAMGQPPTWAEHPWWPRAMYGDWWRQQPSDLLAWLGWESRARAR